MYLFFLFKQKTADERRMSDWGSDVCSSYLDRCVSLPPVEARLTAALLDRYGAVVSRDALARAGWPNGSPGRNALDVHVLRLRRPVAPLTLAIRPVRSRGYLPERSVQTASHPIGCGLERIGASRCLPPRTQSPDSAPPYPP